MQSPKILVVGGSGLVGAELVRLLLARGLTVRTTTSKAPKAAEGNLEQVKVDIASGEGLNAAFQGIEKAFFLAPSGFADQYSVLAPLIQLAKRKGLKKVVLMTAMGANANEATPLRQAELELEKSGLTYNIIRPNWFMQNFHTFWLQGIMEQSKILLPAGKAKVSFIDTRNVAEVAAKLLTTDHFNNQAFDLTGSAALNHDEVATLISTATARSIHYQEIEPEQLKTSLLAAGLPEDYSEFIVLIAGFLKAGHNAGINSNVETILGKKPNSFQTYANDHQQAWL